MPKLERVRADAAEAIEKLRAALFERRLSWESQEVLVENPLE
jgi:N-acyl-L-homoserine lactone synthetase